MPVRRIKQGPGLITDPSPLDVPEGALRRADNVLLHRPGLIQPRPGIGRTTGIASRTTDYRPIQIIPYGGDLVILSVTESTYRLERGSVASTYTGTIVPPTGDARLNSAVSRGSLYVTSSTGIRKLTSAAASALANAGVRTDYAEIPVTTSTTLASSSRHALANGKDVAYRYVWVSEDANGYVRRSAPSLRWVVEDAGANATCTFGRVYLPSGIVAGDRIEIYRTENVTAGTAPGTDYFLAVTHTVTSGEVSAGYIAANTMTDDVPDAKLGTTLYTSTSQEGISGSNEIPPLAHVLAEWGDVMWFGHTQQRRSLTVELVNVFDETDEATHRTGLHAQVITTAVTDDSIDITFVTEPEGLRVGQYVNDSDNGPTATGTHITALTTLETLETRLTVTHASISDGNTVVLLGQTFTWRSAPTLDEEIAIGANSNAAASNLASKIDGWTFGENIRIDATANANVVTVTDPNGHGVVVTETGSGVVVAFLGTLSDPALATNGTAAIRYSDSLTLNGVIFWPHSALPSLATSGTNRTFKLVEGDPAATASNFARCVNEYAIAVNTSFGIRAYRDTEQSQNDASGGVISFIRTGADGAAFSIQCTIRPEAWRPNLAQAFSSEDESFPARLYWSKLQEPEAVPFVNFLDVGTAEKAILALAPLKDSLLVWKEDGLYRITGNAPNSWIVDSIDLQLRLLHRDAWCVLDNRGYGWTDRGVVAVTDGGGLQLVSQQIGNLLRARVETGGYPPGGVVGTGTYMLAHPRLGLVILAAEDDSFGPTPTDVYVFHAGAGGAWASWDRDDVHMAYDPATSGLVAALDVDAWRVFRERVDEDDPGYCYDAGLTVASTGIGTTVTVPEADFGPFEPAVGDVLVLDFDTTARITAVDLDSGTYTLTLSVALGSSSSVGWRQSYRSTLEWHPQHLAGLGHRWQEIQLELMEAESTIGPWPMDVGGYSHRDSSVSTVTVTLDDDHEDMQQVIVRAGLPRAVVRTPFLVPYMSVRTASTFWQLSHVYLHATTTSRRTAR